MQDNQKQIKLLYYNILMISSLLVSAASGLAACKPKLEETALAFETIEQDEYAPDTGMLYESHEPGMTIISRVDEIGNLDGMVTGEAKQRLQGLDYSRYFALAAFQGHKGSIGYSIQVNRIVQQGNSVNVYAQFNVPNPLTTVGATVTSPYHLVKVQKSGSWNQDITFNLFSGDKLVASLVHTIP